MFSAAARRSTPLTRGRASTLGAWGAVVTEDALAVEPYTQLAALARAGYRAVEGRLPWLVRLAPLLSDVGLEAWSAYLPTPVVTGNYALWRADVRRGPSSPPDDYDLDAAFGDACALQGLTTLVVVNLLPQERATLDHYRRFADAMNATGERCKAMGFSLAYHAHSFEYAPIDGVEPFDLLARRFDRDLVKFELDVFWATIGGRHPCDFMRRHAGRVEALHLKDRSARAPRRFTGWQRLLPADAFAPLGSGDIDFASVLRTARGIGVRHRFVEDESPSGWFDNLLHGVEYLETIERDIAEDQRTCTHDVRHGEEFEHQ